MTSLAHLLIARVLAITLSITACLSQVSCQTANYQLNRLMQIPRGILRADADGLPESGAPSVAEAARDEVGLAEAPVPAVSPPAA